MFNKVKKICNDYINLRRYKRYTLINNNLLIQIYKRLQIGDNTISDQLILNTYISFSKSVYTNTRDAAKINFIAVSVLCYYKPHLTSYLIREALLDVVSTIGDEIDVVDILNFIDFEILDKRLKLPEESKNWLINILPNEKELLQKTLTSVIIENRLELDRDI